MAGDAGRRLIFRQPPGGRPPNSGRSQNVLVTSCKRAGRSA
jgi:hypothetical protein